MASSSDAITSVFILVAKENLKPSSNLKKLLTCTQRGYDGDLYESSWRSKGKRYLGYEKDPSSSYVVTDARVIKDDEQVPSGFSGIFLTEDSNEKALRKHVLCIKKEPRQTATTGVAEFSLINQYKGETADPTFYTISHEINDMNITFHVESAQRPANILPQPHQAQKVNEVQLQMPRNTSGPSSHSTTLQSGSPIKTPLTGIDGIPFTINPKYNLDTRINDPIMSSIPVLTVDDINRKFQYDFTLEQETVQQS